MGGEGMTDTPSPDELGQGAGVTGSKTASPGRRRRGLRIALVSLASATVLLGAAAAGSYIYLNHEVGSIPRVPVKFLSKDNAGGGMTVLLTSSQVGPTGLSSQLQARDGDTGLIMLLHVNANKSTGGAVSLPPQTLVSVPGYGEMPLGNVIAVGGPSLLTETVHNLTGVPVNHYARINFDHVASVVDALGGVSVTLPGNTESFGHFFYQGVNHVNGTQALEYARDPSVTETGRVERQGSLMRAVLGKLADHDLLTNPLTMTRVLNALTGMLTVDSTFTNSQVLSWATDLGYLHSSAITFVTAPTETVDGSVILSPVESNALWSAINSDSVAAFAQQNPDTVTPAAP
jgi:LCP family protein required for cell wall assembly